MSNNLRIRFKDDLWWDEISYETAMAWDSFSVDWIDDEICFIKVNGSSLELKRSDYEKLLDDRAFKLKFGIKNHSF